MKKNLNRLFVSAMSLTLMVAVSFITGCNTPDEPDPDARVPNVPASTRGGDGGSGAPGDAGDFNKKKKTSAIVQQSQTQQS